MSDIRLSPKQLAAKADFEKKKAEKLESLKRDYNEVFGSAAGKAVLRNILEISGFLRSDVVAGADGQVHVESSLYNMAYRNFYLKIRANLRPDILRDVENPSREESVEADIFS